MAADNAILHNIYYILVNFATYHNPLTAVDACRHLKFSFNVEITETQFRGHFSELVKEIKSWNIAPKSKLVMSCSRGFCIAETQAQYQEGKNWLKSRLVPLHERIMDMDYMEDQAYGPQLSLNL